MDTWNRLTAIRGEGVEEDWIKEGEGINEKTYMYVFHTDTDNSVVMARGRGGGGWVEMGKGRW